MILPVTRIAVAPNKLNLQHCTNPPQPTSGIVPPLLQELVARSTLNLHLLEYDVRLRVSPSPAPSSVPLRQNKTLISLSRRVVLWFVVIKMGHKIVNAPPAVKTSNTTPYKSCRKSQETTYRGGSVTQHTTATLPAGRETSSECQYTLARAMTSGFVASLLARSAKLTPPGSTESHRSPGRHGSAG